MEYTERDMLINRIISGVTIYNIGGEEYVVGGLDRVEKYRADLVYQAALREARQKQISNDMDISHFIKIKGFWTDNDDAELKKLIGEVDELRVLIFENFDNDSVKGLRSKLKMVRDGIDALYAKKNEYMIYSDTWVAFCAKQRYIIQKQVGTSNETIIDSILSCMRHNIITDAQLRELARTDPWRSIWICHDVGDVFGVPICDLTLDQHRLVLFSIMYDRVYEHTERPKDEVIDDDDALDGWKIKQQRKQKDEIIERDIVDEKLSNPKIAGSQEVFVPVCKDEELKVVNNMNDAGAKIIKKQREMQIQQQGVVSHEGFIDQKLLIEGFRGS